MLLLSSMDPTGSSVAAGDISFGKHPSFDRAVQSRGGPFRGKRAIPKIKKVLNFYDLNIVQQFPVAHLRVITMLLKCTVHGLRRA